MITQIPEYTPDIIYSGIAGALKQWDGIQWVPVSTSGPSVPFIIKVTPPYTVGALDVSGVEDLGMLSIPSSDYTSIVVGAQPHLLVFIENNTDNGGVFPDLSGAPALMYLDVSGGTAITALDVSANPALQTLYCDSTLITALDVSANPALQALGCNSTSITALDVSANPALQTLYCDSTLITALDVSANPALQALGCNSTAITDDTIINSILASLVSFGLSNGYVDLSGGTNAAPTGQGITDVATLVSMGWSVTTN